jgi:hypothetical protein
MSPIKSPESQLNRAQRLKPRTQAVDLRSGDRRSTSPESQQPSGNRARPRGFEPLTFGSVDRRPRLRFGSRERKHWLHVAKRSPEIHRATFRAAGCTCPDARSGRRAVASVHDHPRPLHQDRHTRRAGPRGRRRPAAERSTASCVLCWRNLDQHVRVRVTQGALSPRSQWSRPSGCSANARPPG